MRAHTLIKANPAICLCKAIQFHLIISLSHTNRKKNKINQTNLTPKKTFIKKVDGSAEEAGLKSVRKVIVSLVV